METLPTTLESPMPITLLTRDNFPHSLFLFSSCCRELMNYKFVPNESTTDSNDQTLAEWSLVLSYPSVHLWWIPRHHHTHRWPTDTEFNVPLYLKISVVSPFLIFKELTLSLPGPGLYHSTFAVDPVPTHIFPGLSLSITLSSAVITFHSAGAFPLS